MASAPPAAEVASPPARHGRSRWWRRHPVWTGVIGVVLLLGTLAAPSLVAALTRPGTDTLAARLAEWARTHGLSPAVDFAERLQYDLNPPKVGGRPRGGLPVAAPAAAASAAPAADPRYLALPQPVVPPASPPLPHEGSWSVVSTVAGLPAAATAYLRPDAVHTSYVAGLLWLNPRLVSFALHPGSLDPGSGSWGQSDTLAPGARTGLVAAFNSGFRLYASHGGYYSYGHTADPLRAGTASVVIYRDGRATVAEWGRDARMGPDVVAVRQNLDLIVDGGHPVAGLASNVERRWGLTLGNAYYVWRSGLGVRADGSLVYVAGPSLSVTSLADLLVRTGSVRAMELDINPEWTSCVLYSAGSDPASPTPRNLLPSMHQPPGRYYQPVSRDFFAVTAR